MGVFTGYDLSVTATAGQRASAQPRRAFYGIAEIAHALGLSRQLVTVWRRRRSHGLPEPDAELSSGPIWRGETIEPWIDGMRAQHGASAHPLDSATALRACRRMLRLAALLLEQPPRLRLLSQALGELRELQPLVAASAHDELGRTVRALLAPVDELPSTAESAEALPRIRQRVLAALPVVSEVVRVCADNFFSATSEYPIGYRE